MTSICNDFGAVAEEHLIQTSSSVSFNLFGGLTGIWQSHVVSQVLRMWWWRSRGQRRRIGDSDPGPPHPAPLHPTPPPSGPARDPQRPRLHKPWHWRAQERRGTRKGQKRRGRDTRRWLPRSPPAFSILTPPPHKLAHHYLRCTQVGHCGLKPWQQGSQLKHSQIVWMNIKCSFVFCFFLFLVGGFGFVLYYLICVETLGSVTCFICCGHWRNWPVSSWLKQREI